MSARRIAVVVALVALSIAIRKRAAARDRDRRHTREVGKATREAPKEIRWGALRAARELRNGTLTSLELVRAFEEQCRKVNGHLNALVGTRFLEAEREARHADALFAKAHARGEAALKSLPPLLGVPFVAKECYEYPGMPYTSGIVGRCDMTGVHKNPVLARLEQAGAILLGVGNTSEACMWSESSNPVHGISGMPYDVSRTCGGSSGGTAASLSALCGSFAVTSDVGGSTRIPAFYNGVFGHKASGGAVPNFRSIPIVHNEVERYCQLGPSSRSSEDLFPLLKIMSGPLTDEEVKDCDPSEAELLQVQRPFLKTFEWKNVADVDVKNLRFFVSWRQPGTSFGYVGRRQLDLVRAQKRVVDALENEGIQVQSKEFKLMSKAFTIWSSMLSEVQKFSFADIMSEGLEEGTFWPYYEFFKFLLTVGALSRFTLPALGLAVTDSMKEFTPKLHQAHLEFGAQLRDEMNRFLGDDGVLIFPSLPRVAPHHGPMPNLLRFAEFGATGIFNVLELPATAVPTGLSTEEKVPTGVQIVAANGNDHLTLAVAEHLERLGVCRWNPPQI